MVVHAYNLGGRGWRRIASRSSIKEVRCPETEVNRCVYILTTEPRSIARIPNVLNTKPSPNLHVVFNKKVNEDERHLCR